MFSAFGLALLTVALTGGCNGSMRDHTHPQLLTEGDASDYVVQALEDPSPDQRRKAINRLAETRYVHEQSVLKALALVATSDPSQSVRTSAVMAMGRSADPIVAETSIDIIQGYLRGEARPAPDEAVRTAAVNDLMRMAKADALEPKDQGRAASLGIELLQSDRARNVRVAAAQLLGYCPRKETLFALADSLEQRDFGVCYEAERSLMRLTGRTFNHDAPSWRQFIASTEDPFADRGKLDHELDPPKPKWYEWGKG